jgi:hypothetical protein
MPDPDAPLPPVSREEALQDYDRYIDSVSIDRLTAELQSIEARASHVDLTEAGGAYAAQQAMRALREGAPFSLIRIGDGEGNLLGALDPDFRAARDFSTRLILEMMFGDPDFTVKEIETIRDDMRRAVLSADVLGVSDHVRIGRLQTLRQIPEGREDVRGYMGSYESILQAARLLRRHGHQGFAASSNYVHRQMMEHYAAVIGAARTVTVIGPYDLAPQFATAFSRTDCRFEAIPNQACTSPGQGGKWYPMRWKALCNLDVQPSGLFLVAAGLLGKSLCAEIKQRGGVALDIGSVIDVWRGKPVRNYHNADFMTRFTLAA